MARAATGTDPFKKYPAEDGRLFVVGKDLAHVGEVLWRKLGRAGAFKMVRDPDTKVWRAFRPWAEWDKAYREKAKDAPPLVPPRLIKKVAWEAKAEGIPAKVVLANGWELVFYSSLGKPPNGVDIDGWWFDEEIVDEAWFPEMRARLLDRGGRGVWSATPQAGTDALYDLHEKAALSVGLESPKIEEFVILLAENAHIGEAEKRDLAEDLSDEERRVRIGGEFAVTSYRVYPSFSMLAHGCDPFPVPPSWTRYMVVDPGHQVCCALFAAVPPPDEGDFVYLYDELYLRECDAPTFGEAVRRKAVGQSFQAFVIDMHWAIHTEAGSGKNLLEQYSEALARAGVHSAATGSSFRLASDDVTAGITAVRTWLAPRADGTPKLRVFRNTLPNFEYEIRRYHNQRVQGVVIDKPNQRKNNHAMDCFDAETEVLTYDGWTRFSDLSGFEALATVNLDENVLEYQYPTEMIAKEYAGDMFAFGGLKLDALVTPGHRMVVYPKAGYRGYDGDRAVVKEAQDLTVWDRIKLHAGWRGADCEVCLVPGDRLSLEKEVDPGDYAEFLGWYVAEGCYATRPQIPGRGYQVVVSQTNTPKKALLAALLARLPWKWRETSQGFYASSKQLWEQVAGLGNAYTKRVPDWIKDANPEVIRRFLVGAVLGDGWTQAGRRSYATVSPKLADDIQELFIKLGRSASVRVRPAQSYNIHGRSGDNTVDQYWVSEWVCPHGALRDSKNNPNFKPVPYEGMVYCASVPNGTLVVRRHGKPMVAGNCLRYLVMYNPRYVAPRPSEGKPRGALAAYLSLEKKNGPKGNAVRLGPGRKYG